MVAGIVGTARRWASASAAVLLVVLVPAAPAAATVITVTTAADSIAFDGFVSLREAITAASVNAAFFDAPAGQPGPDLIHFDIAGPSGTVHTIELLSSLPAILEPVILDGYSQAGSSQNTLLSGSDAHLTIELAGGSAGDTEGLYFQGGGTVQGLAIFGFQREAIGVAPGTFGPWIRGNFLGTDATGLLDQGNGKGISVGGGGTVVGGPLPADRNLISGNSGAGIELAVPSGSGTRIEGNAIGTDKLGAALGNGGPGVFIALGGGNVVGGFAGNVIAYNAGDGVKLTSGAGAGNAILRNAIFSNGELGIDLDYGIPEVTPNDPPGALDSDGGPNGLQNYPSLGSVHSDGSTLLTVSGVLWSAASTAYWVELFATDSCDASGFGEGAAFLGGQMVTTNASGGAAIRFQSPKGLPVGWKVTATATDPTASTSELSQCATIALLVGDPVFDDGFELGDKSRWSSAVP